MRAFSTLSAALLCFALSGAAFATETTMTADALIAKLKMEKIPDEGAWFAPGWRSAVRLPGAALPERYGAATRDLGSSIYALVTRRDFSALHRLRIDETWHWYAGDPLELLLLRADGTSELVVMGPDVLGGQRPQYTVPAGTWMGARPQRDAADAYTLFGCSLAPGFDYADYEPGYRDALQRAYPAQASRIAALTRAAFAAAPPAAAIAAAPVPSPTVFAPADVTAIEIAPGVTLRELIGRQAHARSADYSVARFTLAPGTGTGRSYNRVGEEFFLIVSGRGTVELDGRHSPVAAGSVVVMKPGVKHALNASAPEGLDFYAVTLPAFSPDDYVRVE